MGEFAKKVQERRLKWYGHGMRRGEHSVERRVMEMKVGLQGINKRGMCKIRRLDNIRNDIKEGTVG